MAKVTGSRTKQYLLAVGAVLLAGALTRLLLGFGDVGVSPLFFAAVLISAWYGGLGPGLLSTVLSGVAETVLLVGPHGLTQHTLGTHLLRLLVFFLVALLASSLHEATQRARAAAESANAAKSRFLAMVSHELRTPLSPVLMATELLEADPSLAERHREDIRTIHKHVDLEIRLIEDLVDLTMISAGKLSLRSSDVDLIEPLRSALAVCETDLRANQLSLRLDWPRTPLCVRGDPVRLQQVFWNLLRNAIKFTPTGGEISIRGSARPAGQIAIEISDTGIGISRDKLSKIFQAFEQGGPDIQSRFGGLGLGLAICQGIVEAHHGSLTAASDGPGKGATLTVCLPADPAASAMPATGDVSAAGENNPALSQVAPDLSPAPGISGGRQKWGSNERGL